MGIRGIHLMLIGLALALSVAFGVWSLARGFAAMGVVSLGCAAAVLAYAIGFIRRFKAI